MPNWQKFTVESELADFASSLNLYRKALKLRRQKFVGSGEISWQHTSGLLSYKRGEITVVINISEQAQQISGNVLLASQEITDLLPPETAAWLLP